THPVGIIRRPHRGHDTEHLVPHHDGALVRVLVVRDVHIGAADARRHDVDDRLPGGRRRHLDLGDLDALHPVSALHDGRHRLCGHRRPPVPRDRVARIRVFVITYWQALRSHGRTRREGAACRPTARPPTARPVTPRPVTAPRSTSATCCTTSIARAICRCITRSPRACVRRSPT